LKRAVHSFQLKAILAVSERDEGSRFFILLEESPAFFRLVLRFFFFLGTFRRFFVDDLEKLYLKIECNQLYKHTHTHRLAGVSPTFHTHTHIGGFENRAL